MSALEVAEVETGYGHFPVLHGVSLHIEPNEIVGVVGPNGAGKSSLLKAIFGLLPVLAGSIEFEGTSLAGVAAERRPEIGMCLVPQSASTFPDLTVEDNLRVSYSMLSKSDASRALQNMFELFSVLGERNRQRAKTLSGGERQMLAIASALGLGPRFLALDEPTAGLAPTIVDDLIRTIETIRTGGASILWVIEENPLEILPHVDRVYVLNGGVIQAEMPASRLIADEALQDLFFGAHEASND